MTTPLNSPLGGLRVIELSGTKVGAFTTGLFADFGAEVIRLEPATGVALRNAPAYPFLARGTKSVIADVRTTDGAARAKALLADADVFITTLSDATVNAAGLDETSLRAVNPRLVYTSIGGFPRTGPYAGVKGYEGVIMAKAGFMSAFRDAIFPPRSVYVEAPYASFSAAQLAIQGTLAALLEREKSGVGQRVDTNLLQGVAVHDTWNWFLIMISNRFPDAFKRGTPYDAEGTPSMGLAFSLMPVLTKDGVWLAPTQFLARLFPAYLKALGLGDIFTDPEWGLPMMLDKHEKRRELHNLIVERVREKTLAEWRQICDEDRNVWLETFTVGRDVLDHPQFLHDRTPVTITDPERGPVRQPGPMVLLRSTPAVTLTPAPTLGEHSATVTTAAATAVAAGEGVAALGAVLADPTRTNAPLEGVTILDMGTMFAGPFGPTLLADLGARVWKIEALTGDPIRMAVPFPEAGAVKVMQGKESIALDLTKPEGTAIIHELAKRADLCMVSFRPDAARRHGFDEHILRTINPNLVFVQAPGYASEGPYSDRPALAPTIGAAAGVARRNLGASVPAGPDLSNEEIKQYSRRIAGANTVVSAQSDGFGALGVATALLLGLIARERLGESQVIEASMIRTNMHAMGEDAVDYQGRAPLACADGELRGHGALYRIYDTADGQLFLAAPKDREWAPLVAVLGLAPNDNFADAKSREINDVQLTVAIHAALLTRSAAQWETALLSVGVAGVVVEELPPEDLLQNDEFGRASGMVHDGVHPIFDAYPRLAPLVRFSRSENTPGNGCVAGQHTRSILTEIGYDDEKIQALLDAGIIGVA